MKDISTKEWRYPTQLTDNAYLITSPQQLYPVSRLHPDSYQVVVTADGNLILVQHLKP